MTDVVSVYIVRVKTVYGTRNKIDRWTCRLHDQSSVLGVNDGFWDKLTPTLWGHSSVTFNAVLGACQISQKKH